MRGFGVVDHATAGSADIALGFDTDSVDAKPGAVGLGDQVFGDGVFESSCSSSTDVLDRKDVLDGSFSEAGLTVDIGDAIGLENPREDLRSRS